MTNKVDLTALRKAAHRRINDIERKWGKSVLHLAYHAALPVALNADFLHLLRINFFLDPPEMLSYTTEADLLLSSFCHEIGEGLYEIDSTTRDLLLEGLIKVYGQERTRDVATLLWQYSENFMPWDRQPGLLRAQQLTALNFLDPLEAKRWFETAETSTHIGSSTDREWFVAMNQSLQKQTPLIENAQRAKIFDLFINLEYTLRDLMIPIFESKYGAELPKQFERILNQDTIPLMFSAKLISEERGLFQQFFRSQKTYEQVIEATFSVGKIRNTLIHQDLKLNFMNIQEIQEQILWLLDVLQDAQHLIDTRLLSSQPSKLQQRIYEFIRSYIQSEGVSPTHREIGQAMKIASTGHVDYHLSILEKKGYIQREPKARGIRLTPQSRLGMPILGRVTDGELEIFNKDAILEVSKFPLDQWLEKLQKASEQQVLYQIFLQAVQELTDSGYNQIFLLSRNDSTNDEICLVADLIDQGKVTYDIASWNGLIGEAIKSNRTIVVRDVLNDSSYINAERTTRSELAVPFLHPTTGHVMGVLNIESSRYNAFSSVIVEQVETLAVAMAKKIERFDEKTITPVYTNKTLYYSCFVFYTDEDRGFAERLHADLQSRGVQCWSPDSFEIGTTYRKNFDKFIDTCDRFIFILSKHAIQSSWVEYAVEAVLDKETREHKSMLFPVRLDDAIMSTSMAWAALIRRQRYIGDFTQWMEPLIYQQAFEHLLRDLLQKKDPSREADNFNAITYNSCFISYSNKDEALARRLYTDLQTHGVRCWFAPADMKIGDKIRSRIDEAIHVQEKLLLLLSEHSVASDWVESEVEVALEKEQQQHRNVLFPLRLDESVLLTTQPWAAKVRRTRHIGDFTHWTNPQAYQQAFERLLNDLVTSPDTKTQKAIEVFYSYAKEDEALAKELQKHLVLLKRQKIIADWHPGLITLAGGTPDEQVMQHLNAARIILLLVSPDFIFSEEHGNLEVERAMERGRAREAMIVPINLRNIDNWENMPFGDLLSLPRNGLPVIEWSNRDAAFAEIAREIRGVVERFAKS